MTVMITGVGGSIGVHVLAHLMKDTTWDVVGVDSFRHKGAFDRITEVCKDNPEWADRIRIITHDLTAPFTSREVAKIGDVDYIINLASLCDVWESVEDPVPFIRNNVDLMLTMLEYARLVKPKAFIQFSTDEVYGPIRFGIVCDTPWRCDAEKHKHDRRPGHAEWDTILPSNPYAASKAAQEAIAISYWRSYGVPVIITNTMNNFGPMQSASKYPVMIQKAVERGETVTVHASSDGQIGTRFYIDSRNVATALLFILEKLPPYQHKAGFIDRPDRYNIVGDAQVSNLELAETIARLMDKPLKHELVDFHTQQPGHDLHYGLDGDKLHRLGWRSPTTFEDSLKDTIEWQQANPGWIKK